MPSWTSITCKGDAFPELKMPHWEWKDITPFESIVGREDGKPVAIARLFRVRLEFGELVSIQCIGLGGVFVSEAYRRQGAASRLLHAVKMNREHYEHPLVLYAKNERLYAKAGFVTISQIGTGTCLMCLQRGNVSVMPDIGWKLSARF